MSGLETLNLLASPSTFLMSACDQNIGISQHYPPFCSMTMDRCILYPQNNVLTDYTLLETLLALLLTLFLPLEFFFLWVILSGISEPNQGNYHASQLFYSLDIVFHLFLGFLYLLFFLFFIILIVCSAIFLLITTSCWLDNTV
jgi:hypothetical protein